MARISVSIWCYLYAKTDFGVHMYTMVKFRGVGKFISKANQIETENRAIETHFHETRLWFGTGRAVRAVPLSVCALHLNVCVQ